MWFFKRKAVEPELAKPKNHEITVYVRDPMVNVEVNDSVLIAMSLANTVCWLTNYKSPQMPHLLEPQYEALPPHCKVYFVPRTMALEPFNKDNQS